MDIFPDNLVEAEMSFTLKLSILEVLPVLLTLSFAQSKMSASVTSFPSEWDRRFFNNWSILNLINCQR